MDKVFAVRIILFHIMIHVELIQIYVPDSLKHIFETICTGKDR